MKWKNKLHEFDGIAEIYKLNGVITKDIYIFGAGAIGKSFFNIVNRFCKLKAFIDNDKEKQSNIYCGIPVISLEEYLYKVDTKNAFIVLCLKKEYSKTVKNQLLMNGIKENTMFMERSEYEKCLRIMLFYNRNFIYLPIAQISLTERCTLRCEKCAHACNYVSNQREDMTLKVAKSSADYFFKYVDFVEEFVLIGGEPLLYRYLEEIADYIGSKYRNKIGIFSITTNGTLMPQESLLSVCRKYDMLFRVSNYEESVHWLKPKLEKLKVVLREQGVPYSLVGGGWTDYGFGYVDRGKKNEALEKVFDKCWTPCHEVRGDKFYFCVMARSVAENMERNVGTEDYFDLSIDSDDNRKAFFEYTMGYSEKGYLDMCNYCHGADRINYPIPSAMQMK